MTLNISFLFTSLDFRYGPIVFYKSEDLNNDICEKISLRVIVGTLGGVSSKSHTGESIVSLTDDNLMAFSYVFPYMDNLLKADNIRASALVAILPESERLELFKYAYVFSNKFKELSQIIQNKWSFGENLSIEIAIKFNEIIKQIDNEILEANKSLLYTIMEQEEKFPPSFNLLFDNFPKEYPYIVYDLVIGKKLVVGVKDKGSGLLTDATLDFFCPHRDLRKSIWSESYNPIYDLQIGPKSLIQSVPENVRYVDFISKKTKNLNKNNYFKLIIDEISKKDSKNARQRFKEEVNELLLDVGQLLSDASKEIKKIEANESDGSGFKETLNRIKNNNSVEKLELLSDLVDQHDPRLSSRVKELFILNIDRLEIVQEIFLESIGPFAKMMISSAANDLGESLQNFPPRKIDILIDKLLKELEDTKVLKTEEMNNLKAKIASRLQNVSELLVKGKLLV